MRQKSTRMYCDNGLHDSMYSCGSETLECMLLPYVHPHTLLSSVWCVVCVTSWDRSQELVSFFLSLQRTSTLMRAEELALCTQVLPYAE